MKWASSSAMNGSGSALPRAGLKCERNGIVPASFGTVNYWGVHVFAFVNAKGDKQLGKWIFEPVGGTSSPSDDEAKAEGASLLFDDVRERVALGGVAFDFVLQLAQPGDRIDSAVVPLPDERRKVNMGA